MEAEYNGGAAMESTMEEGRNRDVQNTVRKVESNHWAAKPLQV